MIHTYDDAIAYLDQLVATPVQQRANAGLRRTELLLAEVGNPQQRFATLHVTGTSGKGSTAIMAASILRAAGYRVGLFTSPHLTDLTERIVIDGEPVSRADWTRLLERVRPLVDAMTAGTLPGYMLGRPARMQVLWPMAALYFAERAVDIAVVEVGMGGRYDATNVNNARVAVITNVTLEHVGPLGHTLAEIAHHKAGVAKPDGIVVTASREPEALAVIAAECAAQGAVLWTVSPEATKVTQTLGEGGGDAAGRLVRYAGNGEHLRITTPIHAYDDLRLSALGRHQYANAACAVAAVDALGALDIARVERAAVRQGLAAARVPGRLEQVADDPPIWLDGAHNPDAARTLAAALRELFPRRRLVLLLGILGDKDLQAMVAALAPLAHAVVVTEPPWEARGGRSAEVARLAASYVPPSRIAVIPDVPAALRQAQQLARDVDDVDKEEDDGDDKEGDTMVIVTGSSILVGAVRSIVASNQLSDVS